MEGREGVTGGRKGGERKGREMKGKKGESHHVMEVERQAKTASAGIRSLAEREGEVAVLMMRE